MLARCICLVRKAAFSVLSVTWTSPTPALFARSAPCPDCPSLRLLWHALCHCSPAPAWQPRIAPGQPVPSELADHRGHPAAASDALRPVSFLVLRGLSALSSQCASIPSVSGSVFASRQIIMSHFNFFFFLQYILLITHPHTLRSYKNGQQASTHT